MNINPYHISFKGISATATTTDNKKIKIDLPGDRSGLIVTSCEYGDTFTIAIKTDIEERKIKNLKPYFKDIEIDKINGSSSAYLDLNKKIKVRQIDDNGKLYLNHTCVMIDEISGENVAVCIDKGAEFSVEKPSKVTIMSKNLLEKDPGDYPLTVKEKGKFTVISHNQIKNQTN